MNTLDDWVWRSLPEGSFTTNPNLPQKVDENGNFCPFPGNTTVFLLDEETKKTLAGLQKELYDAAEGILAKELDASTFHMTLHDLVNVSQGTWQLEERMAEAETKTKEILRSWKDQPPIRMRATWMFNMVNTSIVLGLKPADDDSRKRLDAMYGTLEGVVPLGYDLCPHITLAYFRPGEYGPEEVKRLRSALRPVEMEVTLSMKNLVLQNFADMNGYSTVLLD